MGARIIFQVKHRGETSSTCLAYLFQNWGDGAGPELEKLARKYGEEHNLDLSQTENALAAVRYAGEQMYGHCVWNGGTVSDDEDPKFLAATEENRRYRSLHPQWTDWGNPEAITCFYGTGDDYPNYIYGWCEDAYVMYV